MRAGLATGAPCVYVVFPVTSTPTPRQLYRALDRGEISREQFRESMREHALALIEEREEVHQNPMAAWIEMVRNRRAASRLARAHGEHVVREALPALSD